MLLHDEVVAVGLLLAAVAIICLTVQWVPGKVAATMNTVNDAADLYLVQNKNPLRLTDTNAAFFDRVSLGSKSKVDFSSPDSTRVEAFITTPPDFVQGQRYPTVLNIHGGPVGQFTWGYDFGTQFLAANGYVVVEPNPRGSTGQGQAFIRGIYQSWGVTDYPDVIAAVDHAVSLGIADPERLAVTGYSYGGYMTNVVITRTDRFRAAASGAGHSLIIANYGHDIYQKWYKGVASSQMAYFVDGYHGGVYGHYPDGFTRFIVDTLKQHPAWKINLEIEPETWDRAKTNEADAFAELQGLAADQTAGGRFEFVNPAYAQPYLWNISGESIIRQFQYGIKKVREHFPTAVFSTYSAEEPCFTSALPGILRSLGYRNPALKNPDTCWGGYVRAWGGELVN